MGRGSRPGGPAGGGAVCVRDLLSCPGGGPDALGTCALRGAPAAARVVGPDPGPGPGRRGSGRSAVRSPGAGVPAGVRRVGGALGRRSPARPAPGAPGDRRGDRAHPGRPGGAAAQLGTVGAPAGRDPAAGERPAGGDGGSRRAPGRGDGGGGPGGKLYRGPPRILVDGLSRPLLHRQPADRRGVCAAAAGPSPPLAGTAGGLGPRHVPVGASGAAGVGLYRGGDLVPDRASRLGGCRTERTHHPSGAVLLAGYEHRRLFL